MCDVRRIQVEFGVDIDLDALSDLKAELETLRPGTVEYSAAWDKLKALHQHFLGRLDGECAAYMNIAKETARQIFGL